MNDIAFKLQRMDGDRMRRYTTNLQFYNGKQWTARQTRGEKQLTVNYAKALVDKVSSYLMAGFSFAVDPADINEHTSEQAAAAERLLYHVHEDNDLAALDFDTEVDCAVMGDAAYKVIWDSRLKRIKITSPDTQGLYAWWHPDDVTSVYQVASRYRLDSAAIKAIYNYNPSTISAWVVELWTDSIFELWVDKDRIRKTANPYGFIPFIIFPNLREPKKFWGISDIPVIIEIQREINRAVSQLSRILELSGNPIAVLENVEGSSDIAIAPGAVWNIPEDARAYLLDLLQGGGVDLHRRYVEMLFGIMHDVSESPRAAWGGTQRDLSGVALEIEMQPLLQKVRRKRLIRSAVYKKRNEMILSLADKYMGQQFGDVRHRIVWGPVLPRDYQRMVANEAQLIQSGVHSRRRAMDDLGVLDPDYEFSQWLEERKQILQMNRDLNVRMPKGERESEQNLVPPA